MRLAKSCVVAFAMYSKLPMPRVDWDKESMKYAMCFFPLIGAVCGAALWLWGLLAGFLQAGTLLYAGVSALLPLLVTGGIHLDGFCDTVDALSSHQSTERRLEILKDPHIGAFGVMGCAAYVIVNICLWSELTASPKALLMMGCGYVLSRSLSGFSVVTFRCARGSGLLAAFSDGAQKVTVRVTMICFFVLCAGTMLVLSPMTGAAAVSAALLMFGYYWFLSYRDFGGTTGDLAGWFLSLCELAMLGAIVLTKGAL